MKKIAIIGAGLGGLALAIRLQAKGYNVTVLEKNALVGGHAYPLHKNGYTFDMGPSLITAPMIIDNLFACARVNVADYLDLIPLDPFYRIYFHDKSFIDYTGDSERMKTQMARFNPKDAAKYDRFMDVSREIYKVVIEEGLGSRPFANLKTLLAFMPRALSMKVLNSAAAHAKRFFSDPRHIFTFSFHPLFIGGNPFRAPAIYQMIPYLEKTGGVHFTRGGMYTLVRALEKVLKELGGNVQTRSEVTEIIVHHGKAIGVKIGNEYIQADAVVSNADFIHTHSKLIRPEHRHKWSNHRLRRIAYSMSAVILFLGVKKQYQELLHHTLILSPRYKELIKDIFDRKVLPDDFSMYLHVPTRTDPDMAPPGCESIYVLIPVANLASGIDWKTQAGPFAEKVLHFLENEFGLTDFASNLQVLEIFTPNDFCKKQNAHLGSAWGVEPRLLQSAIWRPHNRSEDVGNFYLVGASTHPGAGLPGVLLSAEATAKVLCNDLGTPF
jgi:phytoene desaturase